MGATASTFQKYNETASCRKRGETVIPIENVHEQLRMFQHQKDGDILILLKTDAIAFLKDRISSQYHEIFISRRGTEYLDHVSLALKFQASKVLQELSTSTKSKQEPLKRNSKEVSLYEQHLAENPGNFFDFSASTTPTDIPGTINSNSSVDRPKSGNTKYEISIGASPGSDSSAIGGESYSVDRDSTRIGIAGNSEISGAAVSFSGLSVDKESESIRNSRMQSFGSTAYSIDMAHSVDIDSDTPGQSSLSSISKAEGSAGQQSHTSSAAVNFRKHEQELLARARTEGLNRIAELPVIPVVEISPRITPRITPRHAEAKDSPSRIHSSIPLSARNRSITPLPSISGKTTTDVSVLGSSPADSKDSKETPETAAAGLKRSFSPVAYLPFNPKLRKRIMEEEMSQQGVQAKSSDPGFKDEADAAYQNSVMIPRHPAGSDGRGYRGNNWDAKAGTGEEGAFPRLTPRGPALNNAADSKAPSLRSAFAGVESTVSQLTSTLAGIGDVASTYTSYCGTSSYVCPICQQELRPNTSVSSSDMMGRYESHVNTCTMRREMKVALENIDQNLEPKLEELAEYNNKQLALVYSSAIGRAAEEFDECAVAHKIVKKMVKSVLRLTYDTSMKKFQRLQEQLTQVQDHVAASISDAQRAQQQGHLEGQRRLSCFTNLSRILTQTIDKLGHKRQNVLYYRQYLIGIQDFTLIRKLGKGAFASVYLARVTDTSKLYAIKVISKSNIRSGDLYDQIMKERTALSMASRYPNYFVSLQCCFQNKDNLFFALEYMQGGDCLSLLSTVKRLPEHVAQHFIAQVSIALKHLHEHGVIHRDIKPDNVMITARGHVKLGDFGSVFRIHSDYQRNTVGHAAAAAQKGNTAASESSDHPSSSKDSSSRGGVGTMNQLTSEITAAAELAFKRMASGKSSKSSSDSNSQWLEEETMNSRDSMSKDSNSTSENFSNSTTSSLFFNKATKGPMLLNTFDIVGNYFYASPEMAAGACVYNQSVDWWAVGVLLFHMLSGTTPFEGLTKAATLENIERMQCDWDALPTVSPACRNFLERILTHTFDTRLGSGSAEEILHHQFFADIDFNTLYDGYGPLYPRPPPTDETSSDFYCFSLLTDEEALDLPRYSPGKADHREEGGAKGVAEDSLHSVLDSPRAAALRAEEEDYFLDFDYHPF